METGIKSIFEIWNVWFVPVIIACFDGKHLIGHWKSIKHHLECWNIVFLFLIMLLQAPRDRKQNDENCRKPHNDINKQGINCQENGGDDANATGGKRKDNAKKKSEEGFNRLWNWIKNWLQTRLTVRWWCHLFLMGFKEREKLHRTMDRLNFYLKSEVCLFQYLQFCCLQATTSRTEK